MLTSRVWINTPRLTDGVSQQPDTRRFRTQASELKNAWCSVVDGLDKRNGTTHLSRLSTTASTSNHWTHWIDVNSERVDIDPATGDPVIEVAPQQFLLYGSGPHLAGNAKMRAFDATDGSEIHIEDTASTVAGGTLAGAPPQYDYLSSGLGTSAHENIKTVSVADNTFLVNRTVQPAMDAAFKTTAYEYGEAFVFVRAGNYSMDYDVRVKRGDYPSDNIAAHTWDGTGPEPASPPSSPQTVTLKTEDIAEELRFNLNALTGLTATRSGPVVHIRGSASYELNEIEVHDSVGDTNMTLLFNSVHTAVDLPLTCLDGYKIRVTGDPVLGGDDYIIKFNADQATQFSTGTWEQTIEHSTEYLIDKDTMPHRLLLRDGTGVALPSGWTVPFGTPYLEFASIDWDERTTGDSTLNPDPSFIGHEIENIALVRNRLILLADDNVIMSEVNGFFNYFRTDVANLLDSDVIDISLGHNDVNFPRICLGFENDIILGAARHQFRIPGEETLTPKTVSTRHIGSHPMDTEVNPVVSGSGVLYAENGDQFSLVRELYRRGESNLFDSANLTEQVPRYLPGRIREMTASESTQAVAVILDDPVPDNVDRMFVYNFHWSGTDRIQSAWHEWNFGAEKIIAAHFFKDRLYVVLERNDEIYLEYVDTSLGGADLNHDFRVKIDRKTNIAGVTGVYTVADNLTTFSLPYLLAPTDTVQLMTWSYQSDTLPQNVMLNVDSVDRSTGIHTVSVVGDWTGITYLWVGIGYDMEYTFGSLITKLETENGEQALLSGPNHVYEGLIGYDASGTFEVQVTPRGSNTYTYEPDMRVLDDFMLGDFTADFQLSDGELLFPVLCDARSVTIKIVNRTGYPSKIQRAEWGVSHRPRAKLFS